MAERIIGLVPAQGERMDIVSNGQLTAFIETNNLFAEKINDAWDSHDYGTRWWTIKALSANAQNSFTRPTLAQGIWHKYELPGVLRSIKKVGTEYRVPSEIYTLRKENNSTIFTFQATQDILKHLIEKKVLVSKGPESYGLRSFGLFDILRVSGIDIRNSRIAVLNREKAPILTYEVTLPDQVS